MRKPLLSQHKGDMVYVVDAELISDGARTMRVRFNDHTYFWPKKNAEMISPGRFALKQEFYDMMYSQDEFKKTIMVKSTFLRNMGKVPVPKLRKFSK